MRSWLLAFIVMGTACGGSALAEGRDLFNAGRYAEAKAKLERIDDGDYRGLDARTRTTYALYRGLVFGALGDRPNAGAWLGLAKQTEEDHPGTLNHDDLVRLKLAEEQYGPLPSTSAPPPSSSR
jgi:hypothetical protein